MSLPMNVKPPATAAEVCAAVKRLQNDDFYPNDFQMLVDRWAELERHQIDRPTTLWAVKAGEAMTLWAPVTDLSRVRMSRTATVEIVDGSLDLVQFKGDEWGGG